MQCIHASFYVYAVCNKEIAKMQHTEPLISYILSLYQYDTSGSVVVNVWCIVQVHFKTGTTNILLKLSLQRN